VRAAVVAPLLVAPPVIAGLAHTSAHHLVAGRTRSAPRSAVGSDARRRYSVSIQTVFDLAGNPSLVANFSPDGSLAVPEWSICHPPDVSACSPPVTTAHAILTPGPEPAGTVFRASARYGGRAYGAGVTWRGPVRIVSRPRLLGPASVGAAVTPAMGAWGGGWGTESDQLGVEACRTTRGRSCVMLSGGQLGCPDGRARVAVGGWFTGWYLFAVDARSPRDEGCAGVAFAFPADVPPWPVGRTIVRSLPIGPVIGRPAPKVTVLRHATYQDGRVLVARIRCPTRCHVSISVQDPAYLQAAHTTVTGTTLVGVPRAHLAPGRLLVLVNVDSGPTITRKSELS
jgi:hypothetical protein